MTAAAASHDDAASAVKATRRERVAIDVTAAVRQGAGIGRYARELARALLARHAYHYLLFSADRTPRGTLADLAAGWPSTRYRASPFTERLHNLIWHRLGLWVPAEIWTGRLDLYHCPDFLAPPVWRARRIVTIHDLSFYRCPERAPAPLVAHLVRTVPRAVRTAERIVTDSEHTRRELEAILGVDPQRVTVAYPGVGPEFRPRRGGAPASAPWTGAAAADRPRRPYVLGVGTLEPRKDWPALIEAFGRLGELAQSHDLVIAGAKGWLTDDIFHAAAENDHVLLAGYVPDDELPALYGGAEAFVYPSVYEGFGLPVLEALACGTPTIIADASSLPEVAGDAALRFAAGDGDALARQLARLLTDAELREQLSQLGPVQAARFTWAACAAAVEGAYGAALSARRPKR